MVYRNNPKPKYQPSHHGKTEAGKCKRVSVALKQYVKATPVAYCENTDVLVVHQWYCAEATKPILFL